VKTTLYTTIKVCIFNNSDDVSRFNIFKKFFECINSNISFSEVLHQNTCSLSKCTRHTSCHGAYSIRSEMYGSVCANKILTTMMMNRRRQYQHRRFILFH